MTQITSIKLGVIVMCVVTVPWSLAQRPRTATNGSNQTGVTTPALAGQSGFSNNSTSAAQPGTNLPSLTITGANTNAGARIGINAGAQDRDQQSNRWDHRQRRWGSRWLKRQIDGD
jgi:hypothetical protein